MPITKQQFQKDMIKHFDAETVSEVNDFLSWCEDNSSLNESLVISVIDQFDADSFLESASDVANHGISGGFGGWIYYNETEPFYVKNKDLIIEWAKETNDSLGMNDSYLGMIANFNIMKNHEFNIDNIAEFIHSNDDSLDDFTLFANGMAWAVAEEVCNAYVNYQSEKVNS